MCVFFLSISSHSSHRTRYSRHRVLVISCRGTNNPKMQQFKTVPVTQEFLTVPVTREFSGSVTGSSGSGDNHHTGGRVGGG